MAYSQVRNIMARVQVALNVSNIDAAVDFYSRAFRATVHKRRPGYANFEIADPPMKLVLFEVNDRGEGSGNALNHIGIEVPTTEDVGEQDVALSDAGLEVRREDGMVCCHAQQDKLDVVDPDGLEWETYAVTDESPDGLALLGTDNCCA
jgi:catechol 2,3-dioxygenase-like lactoylglutathione lyase family enzyme|tara:strand:+ start:771 stop:1217 length:447 start_codon:yes stop_codon:yes gene_type:complete